jgi:translation initiation factor IF-2
LVKKKRVYEVARDLKISSEALVEIIRALGAEVKSHMSAVDDSVVDALHAQFDREKEKIKRADEAKRDRQRVVPEVPAGPPAEAPLAPSSMSSLAAIVAEPSAPAPAVAERTPDRASEAAAAPDLAPPVAAAPPPPAPAKPAKPAAAKPAAAKPMTPRPAPGVRTTAPPLPPKAPTAFRRPTQSAIAPGAAPPPRAAGATPRPAYAPRPGGARPGPGAGRDAGPGRREFRTAYAAPPPPEAAGSGDASRRRSKDKRQKKAVDQRKIRENVRKTMHVVDGGKKTAKHRRKTREEGGVAVETVQKLRATEYITLAELASLMEESPAEVIAACLRLGFMATINQRLDKDSIIAIADEFEYEVEFITEYGSDQIEAQDEEPEQLEQRPPVVTVMGHVDHGKTSLLDRVRHANVVATEAGRITQHIGAYAVVHKNRRITFLDTPGHAAFTAMRARGAQVTDIVVLVVAADDRVMPQTIEAIDHAKAAGVPIVVAINKIDLPSANVEMVKTDLSRHGLIVEEFGGKVVAVPISAKSGQGIDHLLDMILLEADLAEFKADPHKPARGVIIESKIEQGRGIVGTVLVQRGSLRVGDAFVCGVHSGRVRAMHNEAGDIVDVAGPSIPVEVLGWDGLPQAGDSLTVLRDDREAREIAHKRQILAREQSIQRAQPVTLADFRQRIEAGVVSKLNLILKADGDGSVEALSDSLEKLATEEVQVEIIHRNVGNVNESDVLLAAASNAVIVGFHVRTEARASTLAHEKGVDVNIYRVIYEAVDDVKKAMAGLLKPTQRQVVLGAAEVRQVFRLPRGVIAGCYVTEGKLERSARARVIRNQESVFDGKLGSLKRFKDDVREVAAGFECGLTVDGYDQIQMNDIVEVYRIEEVARTL